MTTWDEALPDSPTEAEICITGQPLFNHIFRGTRPVQFVDRSGR
jgi:hypothetical protein